MQIQNYGFTLAVFILLSIALTYLLYRKEWNKQLSFWGMALPVSLLSARLFYLLPNLKYYFGEVSYPLATLFFWDGGLSLFGAMLGLLLSLRVFFKNNTLEDNSAFQNALLTSLWLFIAGLRFAEGFTNMGLGRPFPADSAGLFQILNGSFARLAVHQIECVFALLLLIFFVVLYKKNEGQKKSHPYIAWLSLLLLSASQLVFVSLRNDEHMIMGFVYIQQVLFALFTLFFLYFLRKKLQKEHRMPSYLFYGIVFVLVAIAFAMEFVVDGRLHFPFQIFSLPADWRNYLVISLVALGFVALGVQMIRSIDKQNS